MTDISLQLVATPGCWRKHQPHVQIVSAGKEPKAGCRPCGHLVALLEANKLRGKKLTTAMNRLSNDKHPVLEGPWSRWH